MKFNQKLIERLRNGEIAVKNIGNTNPELVAKIMNEAFPNDSIEANGGSDFYFKSDEGVGEWASSNIHPNLPTYRLSDFMEPDKVPVGWKVKPEHLDRANNMLAEFLSNPITATDVIPHPSDISLALADAKVVDVWLTPVYQDEKVEKVKQWEIQSFSAVIDGNERGTLELSEDGTYGLFNSLEADLLGSSVHKIHSVKRLSDGEVFMVGDGLDNGELLRFEIDKDGDMWVGTTNTSGTNGIFLSAAEKASKTDTVERPPLGLRPIHIAIFERQKEILEAMERYVDAGKDIPHEWIEELKLHSVNQKP
jgi:hypothetical protein